MDEDVDWQSVVRSLSESLGDEESWSELQAEVINRADTPTEEVATSLREQVRAASRAINQIDGAKRDQKLRKLRSFIKTLNPELRKALVAQESETFSGAQDVLADLADVLPLKEVLEALRQVSVSSAEPSTAALRMFHQLARTCVSNQEGAAELQI